MRILADLVARWSARINLVSRQDVQHLWERHIQDSLALQVHIPPGTTAGIDLGSGAGFPGLVLAIATDIPFTLIESDKRKAAFLQDAARLTAAPVRVLNCRIEQAEVAAAPLVTARALAPLDRLLGLARRLLTADGIGLFPKGRSWQDELMMAQTQWQMTVEAHPRLTDPETRILKVSHINHV